MPDRLGPQRQQPVADRAGGAEHHDRRAEREQRPPVRDQHRPDREVAGGLLLGATLRAEVGHQGRHRGGGQRHRRAPARTRRSARRADQHGAEQRPDEDPDPVGAAQAGEGAGAVGGRDGLDHEALPRDQERGPRHPADHDAPGRARATLSVSAAAAIATASSSPAASSARFSPIRAITAPAGSDASSIPTPSRPTTRAAVPDVRAEVAGPQREHRHHRPVPDRDDHARPVRRQRDVPQPELLRSGLVTAADRLVRHARARAGGPVGDVVEGVRVRAPVGRPRRGRGRRCAAIWSAVSSKSKSVEVLLHPLEPVVFGKTMSPRCRCQRRTTCAGSGRRRRRSRRWWRRRPIAPWAIGDQASVTTPCRRLAARTASLRKNGWTSTWLTTGTTPVSATIRSRWAGWKFETPIEVARPSSTNSARVRQVETKSPSYRVGSGQWMRNRSIRSRPSRSRDSPNGGGRRRAGGSRC